MPYIPTLDGLRAIAVLVVMGFHARAPGFGGGFLGVDVFFVLSGYLITRILAEEHDSTGKVRIGRFYLRRLRRLYPALLAMLAAYLLIAPKVFPGLTDHVRDAALSALYLTDYGRAFWKLPVVLQHTWSLSIEEHFYLLWAPAMALVMRLARRVRVPTLITLAVAATAWRWGVTVSSADWAQPYYRFDTRLSGLFVGAAIGLAKPRLPTWAGAAGAVMILVAGSAAAWRVDSSLMGWMLCAEVGTAVVIASADRLPVLGASSLVWLGRLSYGIYLWHYPIFYWMREFFYAGWAEILLFGGILSIIAAAISYMTVEAWFRAPAQSRKKAHPAARLPKEGAE